MAVQPSATLTRLTPEATQVLAHADQLRASSDRREIHMEHLVWALFERGGPDIFKRFGDAGLPRRDVLDVLREEKDFVPRDVASSTTSGGWAFSPHAARALESAGHGDG